MIKSTDTWQIGNTTITPNSISSIGADFDVGSILSATIPTLNGGTPMVTGGSGGSFGNSSSYPTITIGGDGEVTVGSQNVATMATIVDSISNTGIDVVAAANSVKTAYDTAITAFTNAAARADSAYSNAITFSGNAALAYANAIAWSGNAALAFANAALRADAAYTNAISYSGNAALAFANAASRANEAYANAVLYANTNVAFRGAAQTISAVWTYSANIVPSSNAINLGNTTQRWIIVANTISTSGAITAGGNSTFHSGSDNILTIQGNVAGSNYGMLNLRGGGTNLGYIIFGNSTNGERARIAVDDSRQFYFSSDSGSNYYQLGSTAFFPPSNTISLGLTNRRWILSANTGSFSSDAGYLTIPATATANNFGLMHIIPEIQDVNYSILLDDGDQMKRFTSGASVNWTVSNTATTNYPPGFNFWARNVQANTLNVIRAAGVTIREVGSSSNADVAIAQWELVRFVHEVANEWLAIRF